MFRKFRRLEKALVVVLTLTVGLTMLSGCGNKKPENGKTDGDVLNVFNWSEYLPNSVIKQFEKKYNIKVNYTTYSSNEEMLAKIMAGGSQFDLAVSSDYMVDIMKKQELLENIDLKNIPNFNNIGSQFKNLDFDKKNKYSVPYMWGDAVIAVNTKQVKDNITCYSDLWNKNLKNSMVVLDDERAIIGLALKKLGYSLNETDSKKLVEAKKELLKLKPNIKTFDSDSPKTSLINGEASVGYVWGAEAALAARENKNIKIVIPKEGLYLWQDNFVIPKGAEHEKNAELFINFILDPKISAEISKAFPYANPNVKAHKYISKTDLNNIAIYPPEDAVKKGEHLKDVGEKLKDFDKIWTEFKQ